MKNKVLSYGRQWVDDDDIAEVVKVLKGDWLTQGPAVAAFEKTLADYVGVKHAVTFVNGTAALHGAMAAAGLGHGDRLLTTPLTFAATANAALYVGAEPVFADIDPKTLCLDPVKAEAKLKELPRIFLPLLHEPIQDTIVHEACIKNLPAPHAGREIGRASCRERV